MYEGTEAAEMRRQRARESTARYRVRLISQQQEKDDNEGETGRETSTGSSDSAGSSADSAPEWHRIGFKNSYWPLQTAGG